MWQRTANLYFCVGLDFCSVHCQFQPHMHHHLWDEKLFIFFIFSFLFLFFVCKVIVLLLLLSPPRPLLLLLQLLLLLSTTTTTITTTDNSHNNNKSHYKIALIINKISRGSCHYLETLSPPPPFPPPPPFSPPPPPPLRGILYKQVSIKCKTFSITGRNHYEWCSYWQNVLSIKKMVTGIRLCVVHLKGTQI